MFSFLIYMFIWNFPDLFDRAIYRQVLNLKLCFLSVTIKKRRVGDGNKIDL